MNINYQLLYIPLFTSPLVSLRSLALPIAILLGFVFHHYCGMLYCIVPALVFTNLFINYTAVDVRKLKVTPVQWILTAIQLGLCVAAYLLAVAAGADEVIAHGILVGILMPVAAAVVVISCALGARRETVTSFTILNNFVVSIAAPIVFSFVGRHQEMPFFESFWKIFCRICPQIVFPFLVTLLLQIALPKVNHAISKIKWTTLYVWAFTLTIVLGKTFDDIITATDPHWEMIGLMCIIAIVLCFVQFRIGNVVGRRHGEKRGGGQLLGQKNTSFGIWMAVEYLNPLSAVFPAIYSVCQNIYNSWQMYLHDKRGEEET